MSDDRRKSASPFSASRKRSQPSEIAQEISPYGLTEPVHPYPELVAQLVFRRLGELEASYAEGGRSLEELGSPEELAERMVATVPEPSPWGELGPFYSTRKIAKLLGGVSRQAIADRRKRGTLLGLRTADGVWVYPNFQLDDHHRVLSGLPEVLRILRASEVDEWTLASWLTSPMRSLEDRSPIDWLRQGGDRETLLTLVRDAARRFSQ